MNKQDKQIAEAAELLGMKPDEITGVEDSPAGTVFTTRDDTSMILVPDDKPDAAGQTGLMFAVAPTENYSGIFPVYAGPANPKAKAAAKAPALDAEYDGVAIGKMTKAQLDAAAEALGEEVDLTGANVGERRAKLAVHIAGDSSGQSGDEG